VLVGEGDAHCWLRVRPDGWTLHHSFYAFHNISIRYSYRSTGDPGSGGAYPGGTGSGGTGCRYEWLALEINRNDGKGWVLFWEGFVTVCD